VAVTLSGFPPVSLGYSVAGTYVVQVSAVNVALGTHSLVRSRDESMRLFRLGSSGGGPGPIVLTASRSVVATSPSPSGPRGRPVTHLTLPVTPSRTIWYMAALQASQISRRMSVAGPAALPSGLTDPPMQAPPSQAAIHPHVAPRIRAHRWVPVHIDVALNGKPRGHARVAVQALGDPPQARQATLIANAQGVATDWVWATGPGPIRVVASTAAVHAAARVTGRVPPATKAVTPPPWWLLLLLLLVLARMVLIERRRRHRRARGRPVPQAEGGVV
jgi:hypothetical protein